MGIYLGNNWCDIILGTDYITPTAVLRGHERGIDSVGVSPDTKRLATGGWDTNLKIWSTSLEDESDEPSTKRSRGVNALVTKLPTNTLKGHKEAISSVEWVNNSEICTASMDHTIKFWDAEVIFYYFFAVCLDCSSLMWDFFKVELDLSVVISPSRKVRVFKWRWN